MYRKIEDHLLDWKNHFDRSPLILRGARQEVDFLIARQGEAVPVEVKSAATGRLRSLHLYYEKYAPKSAFIVCAQPYHQLGNLTWIPFYGVGFALGATETVA